MFRLETLGGLRLAAGGRELVQPRMRLALLARLAAAGEAVTRDELLACFWPERDTDSARHSLDQLLYELRQSLRCSPIGGTAALHLEPGVITSDLAEFQAALRVGDLSKAVAQYAGSFLQGFYLSRGSGFERWAESMRSDLQVSYQRALETLAAEATAAARHTEAVEFARRLVTTDPVSARATLTLMRALVASGDRASAIDWAQKHERIVRAELETDPDPAVLAFVRQLRELPEPEPTAPRTGPGSVSVVPGRAREGPTSRATALATGRSPARVISTLKSHRWRWLATVAAMAIPILFVASLQRSHDLKRPASASRDAAFLTVVPFVNVGGDSAQAYLADGISDELATALGKTDGIRVVGRSAAREFKGRGNVDARDVGRAIGAEFVVQGSVRRAADRLRVSAQLARTETGEEVWANAYERPTGDAFAVQDEIVQAIADAIRSRFGGNIGARPPHVVQRIPDAGAYDLYLRGQYHLRLRGAGVRLAAAQFDSAIARDSNFAPAYAGLSAALALFPYFANTPPAAVYTRVAAAASGALARDSTLSEPHTALALAAMRVHAWPRADSEHRKALAAEPTDASAHHQYGRYLSYIGQVDSALAEFRRAESLDRYSALYSSWVGHMLFEQGKMEEALKESRRALDIDSLNPVAREQAAQLYASIGDTIAARAMVALLPNTPPWTASKVYISASVGDRLAARDLTRGAKSLPSGRWFDETITAYAALGIGDTARALAALERATDADEIWMLFDSAFDRIFDPIRSAPRFQLLLQRVGLIEHR